MDCGVDFVNLFLQVRLHTLNYAFSPSFKSQAAALLGAQPGEFIGFSAFAPVLELEQVLFFLHQLFFLRLFIILYFIYNSQKYNILI